jgi:hypothetical protein
MMKSLIINLSHNMLRNWLTPTGREICFHSCVVKRTDSTIDRRYSWLLGRVSQV